MNAFAILMIIASFIILITAVARLNDLRRHQSSTKWWVRRIGLLFVAVAACAEIASYFTLPSPYWSTVTKLLFLWGVALTWMTTPGMPPWSKYVFKGEVDANARH